MRDVPDSEVEFLAASAREGGLAAIFDELESDTFEELLALPIWAGVRRKNALIERVKVVRDVRQRIRLMKATRSAEARNVT